MEIERKFLIQTLPDRLEDYPHIRIEQGYLCTAPVLRIRRMDDAYIFTYKSAGLMSREELEASLTEEAYLRLIPKCDGNLISKTRYRIPEEHGYTIEFDLFHGCYEGLMLAEVEFPSEAEAHAFSAPDWFTYEVTQEPAFHNSTMATAEPDTILAMARNYLQQGSLP